MRRNPFAFAELVVRAATLAMPLLGQGCTLLTSLDSLSWGSPPPDGGGGSGGEPTALHRLPLGGGGGSGGDGGRGGDGPPACPDGPVVVDAYAGLRLNEIAPNGSPDWVEVVNIGTAPIELCGCMVAQGSDGVTVPSDPEDVDVLAAAVLQPASVYVLPTLSFGIAKSDPESIALFDPKGVPIDHTAYVASPADPYEWNDVWARIPDGVGDFTKTKGPTKGMPNQ